MNKHEKINYLEFPTQDITASKTFFAEVFAWRFIDYGSEYTAFSNAGIKGGMFKAEQASLTSNGAALIIFYSDELEKTLEKVEKAGGKITQAIFSFPGGRRFHFTEPSGNEFAVWSEL